MQTDIRYPIGKFEPERGADDESRRHWINMITVLPGKLAVAVDALDEEQLGTPYRLGGWTVREVVHHIADSHLNAYVRLKLALTEECPTIKLYDQDAWSDLPDVTGPVAVSLTLVEALHIRWSNCLKALTPEQFERTLTHPEYGDMSVATYTQRCAWHGRHHIAHITGLCERMGW